MPEIKAKLKGRLNRVKLTLFFCLIPLEMLFLTGFAFAAPPTVGTITPASGSTPPDTAIAFTTTYSDPDGSTDIRYAGFLLYPTSSGNYGLLVYDQLSNLLYLTSDINSGWLGGFPPGSANTISNTYLSLDYSQTRASAIGPNLSITWSITPKPAFSGRLYTTLLLAIDKTANNNTNWSPKGSYSINFLPEVLTLSPSSGSSSPDEYLSFTTTYSDKDTHQNIQYSLLAFYNPNTPNNPACILGYDRLNHKLYLLDDNLTNWLGGFSPGQSSIIENSWLKLDCSLSTVQGSNDTLTITWRLSFKPLLQGQKNLYLLVIDQASGSSGWIERGSWTIQSDTTPPTGSITINDNVAYTNSLSATLTLSAQDNPGGSGLSQMQFSNDNLTWSAPEAYSTTKAWILSSGEGEKTVYVKFNDAAGNWSVPISDTIILDITSPEGVLQKVAENYQLIEDLKANMTVSTILDLQPLGEEGYYIYYFKKPNKEKIETYSSPERITKTDIVIINGPTMYLVSPDTKAIQQVDLLVKANIDSTQFNQQDIYYNLPEFLNGHTVTKNEGDSDLTKFIAAIEAVPKTTNPLYTKLELFIDYKKGLLTKSLLFKDGSLREKLELQESQLMPNGAWVPVKQIKVPMLTSGNLISTLTYSDIQINTGLTDDDFNPIKQ